MNRMTEAERERYKECLHDARREALEEAAKVCEGLRSSEPYDPEQSMETGAFQQCAAAIRALIDPKPPEKGTA